MLTFSDDFCPFTAAPQFCKLRCLCVVFIGHIFSSVSCWSHRLRDDIWLASFNSFLPAISGRRFACFLLAFLGRRWVQWWRWGISFTFKIYVTATGIQLLPGLITSLVQPWYASLVGDGSWCDGLMCIGRLVEQCLQVPTFSQCLDDFTRRYVRRSYAHVFRMVLVSTSGSSWSLSTPFSHFVIACSFLYHILYNSRDERRLYKKCFDIFMWNCTIHNWFESDKRSLAVCCVKVSNLFSLFFLFVPKWLRIKNEFTDPRDFLFLNRFTSHQKISFFLSKSLDEGKVKKSLINWFLITPEHLPEWSRLKGSN